MKPISAATISATLLLLVIATPRLAIGKDYGDACTNPQNPADCDTPNTLLICWMTLKCECLTVTDNGGYLPVPIRMSWDASVKRCKSRASSACSAEAIELEIPSLPGGGTPGKIKFDHPIECQSGVCEKVGDYPSLHPKLGKCSSASFGKYVSSALTAAVLVVGFIGNKILS